MSGNLSLFGMTTALAASAPIPYPSHAQPRPAVTASQFGAPHVFGTIALPLRTTRFDDRWRRVLRSGALAKHLMPLLRTARQAPKIEQLRMVNGSLNDRIRYRYDTGSGDHWSTAGETLSQSAGDCEDYVIAKLHALKLLGVPERDLFMTIGHDGVAGAVHAVLVARVKGQFYILDNRTNQLIPDNQYRGFYPIITFGTGSRWLHGYQRGKTPAAVKAISIALQKKRELPLGNSRGSVVARAMPTYQVTAL